MLKQLLLIGYLQYQIYCITFTYLLDKQQQCFTDSLGRGVVIAMQVISNSTQFTFKAERAEGKKYLPIYNLTDSVYVRFTYTTVDKISIIKYCFQTQSSTAIKLDINYKTGSETNDFENIATRDHLNLMEIELNKLDGISQDIKRQKSFMNERETSTNLRFQKIPQRIIAFGLLCIGIFFVISYISMQRIKRVLVEKKLT